MYWRKKSFYDWCGKCIGIIVSGFVCFHSRQAKRADENLMMIYEKNQKNEKERESENGITETFRVIEKEIKRKCVSCILGLGVSRNIIIW